MSADAASPPDPEIRLAGTMLRVGRSHDRAGRFDEAMSAYEQAFRLAEQLDARTVMAEALRRQAVIHHRHNEYAEARRLCRLSFEEAMEAGDRTLAGEALNALAGISIQTGELDQARSTFLQALSLADQSGALLGRIHQNLGILANIQGDHQRALAHYRQSLEAFELAGDERGCAIAYHNLGLIASHRGELDEAEQSLARSAEIAAQAEDVHLEGLCELTRAVVAHRRNRYDEALRRAESALGIFEQLGARAEKSTVYRVLGMVFRDTGRPVLAESRLRASAALAVETGAVLAEAESSRELALLYQGLGRNQEALTLLNQAHGLFNRLEARVELVDVAGKQQDLENTFLAVVREWGQSIESSDRYTFGHCERVAQYAVAVARHLGLDSIQQTTVRLGAYLHDVGKVKVPHEILNKPGRLTGAEFDLLKLHTIHGLELLSGVEFPWDLKPIIRWHHEKLDGSGYPDGLQGDEIPLSAQIIGIVDVFDALTTTRSYRPAMSRAEALAEMERCRSWWRPEVYGAFLAAVGSSSQTIEPSTLCAAA
ncbi:MAG: HD domain-containing phosphohydrolase [Gemmatimonadales bacterium]